MSITGSNNPFPCSPVVFSAGNSIISLGTITRVGNVFTFSVGFVWKINGVTYQNTAPIDLTIEEAPDGYFRIDNALLNTSHTIELQQGLPSETIALRPTYPENNILLTSWNISSDTISDEEAPILGSSYIKKEYSKSVNFTGTGSNVVIPLSPEGYSEIRLVNSGLVSISGVDLSLMTGPNYESPYQGKEIMFFNLTGVDVLMKFDDFAPAEIPFNFIGGVDLLFPANEKITFKYDATDGLYDISKSWTTTDDVIGLQAELDLKLDIADYNDRYKGKYTSLINLQAAHPTANDGDTAIVDAGPGTNAIEYIWDANEGWVQGNSVGATTTDALPEGSTNLYHTPARVLATVLSGISFATGGSIVSTDTILQAFGKIQKQINDLSSVFVPQTRKITIGGVTQDLSADRTFTVNGNKRTISFTYEFNGALNTATNNWWGVLGNGVPSQLTPNASFTPTDSFSAANVQSPAWVVPFNCRLKSITFKGFSNTGSGVVDLAFTSGTFLNTGAPSLSNSNILSNQPFTLHNYLGITNGSNSLYVFDTGFTNYIIPKGYEIRMFMNNRNVAKNLLSTTITVEFEEEI